ncbi:MAG: hydantoinase/oxoprolinase family protein, partial [Chloroflexi bacterium]|nr:hydantoinase/oxoprolinase family protein [Chloroflexota bacterium]
DDGFPEIAIRRFADLRYAGQSFELTVPADGKTIADLEQAFAQEHERTYGHRATKDPTELVNLRLVVQAQPSRAAQFTQATPGSVKAPDGQIRAAYFGSSCGKMSTPVLSRRELGSDRREGPLIIEEYDSTTVVPPGCVAYLDPRGNVLIDVGEGG